MIATETTVDDLIVQYEKLVTYCLGRWTPSRYRFLLEDRYLSAGYTALWRAAKGFDPNKGTKFITYATNGIRQAMLSVTVNYTRSLRKKKERQWGEVEDANNDRLAAPPSEPQGPSDYVTDLLRTLLSGEDLTETERWVLTEHYDRQRTTAELATERGVKVTTVREWRRSAVKKLKRKAERLGLGNKTEPHSQLN